MKSSFCILFIFTFIILTQFVNSTNAQISGKVFIDYDINGNQSPKGTEPGIGGVKVYLFLSGNDTPYIARTDSEGQYYFSAEEVPVGKKVRIEFTDLPHSYEPSFHGLNHQTEIQFAQAPANNINLGIVSENEFCQMEAGVKVATACYIMGDPLKGGDSGEEVALVLLVQNFKDSSALENVSKVELVTAKAIGATWSSAYHRSANMLFLGAIARRHVGLGPLGTGGLYTVDLATKKASGFLDLKTIGINTGPDPHLDPLTNLNVLPAQKTARSIDSLAFHAAGKTGLGGMQFNSLQDTLFIVNLYEKKLYGISVANSFVSYSNQAETNSVSYTSYTIPHPNCPNGEFVPWAVKYYRGSVYLGVVCTAETSQRKEDLKAAVYQLNPSTSIFTNIFEFDLNFRRGPIDNTEGCNMIDSWLPWTKVFPKQCNRPNGGFDPISAFIIYPQPILSDIEFDEDGSLFLGFMDRTGLQTAENQPGIAKDDTLNYYGFMSGDLLRVQRNNDGTFSLEKNAKSGNLFGCGPDSNTGPGGGEFFCDDYWLNGQGSIGHGEITNGALFKIPGTTKLITTAMDPVHGEYLSAGLITFNTKRGKRDNSFKVYSNRSGTLGKSGGLGDLSAICQPLPLSIGNLVWYDKDKDGIQDPNEDHLDDIVVTLHDMQASGIEVARDTTCYGGQYFFDWNNVKGGLKVNHNYEVRIDLQQVLQTGKLIDKLGLYTVASVGDSLESLSKVSPHYNYDKTQVIVKVNTEYGSKINYTYDIGLVDIFKGPKMVDVELKTNVIGGCIHPLGKTVNIEVIVHNLLTTVSTIADSIYVADTLSANFTLLSAVASQGIYNVSTHLWGPLALKPGKTDTLTLTVNINQNNSFKGGILYNEAEVVQMIGNDMDSRPNNHLKTEDDYDITSLSVPIVICPDNKDRIRVFASLGHDSYQWLKNGIRIEGANESSLEVSTKGSYAVETVNGNCAIEKCCPIIIEENCNCPTYCIPVLMKIIKKELNGNR